MNTPPISRKIRHAFFPLLTASVLLGISPGAQSAAIDLFSTSQAQILDNTGDGTPVSISVGDGTDPSILGGS
ncbi:MAG: hypothetical protein GQ582_09000, partial [Methyloprofundus sp.]|nr:hypothetical protein [Methyloprofundus sp.]